MSRSNTMELISQLVASRKVMQFRRWSCLRQLQVSKVARIVARRVCEGVSVYKSAGEGGPTPKPLHRGTWYIHGADQGLSRHHSNYRLFPSGTARTQGSLLRHVADDVPPCPAPNHRRKRITRQAASSPEARLMAWNITRTLHHGAFLHVNFQITSQHPVLRLLNLYASNQD